MQDQLIGYLLKALDEDELRLVEELLKENQPARQQLEILRIALIPLEHHKGHEAPPHELGARTCELVRRARGTEA